MQKTNKTTPSKMQFTFNVKQNGIKVEKYCEHVVFTNMKQIQEDRIKRNIQRVIYIFFSLFNIE